MNVAANVIVTFGHCEAQTTLFRLGHGDLELYFLGKESSTLQRIQTEANTSLNLRASEI